MGGRPVTPDEARDLLYGTTPGPWYLSSSQSVVGIDIVMYDGTVMERRNVALASAAPTLAAMIAGMREEWGMEAQLPNGDWLPPQTWHDSPDRAIINVASIHGVTSANRRIVRRYVTEPEEIE